MINLSNITKALTEQLNNNVAVRDFINNKVLQGELINNDPNQAPWIGVYRGKTSYEPRTLGSMDNWEAFPKVKIIVQATDLRSAVECELALEGYVEAILRAIIADTTLGGTVDMINSYDVEPGYMETESTTLHFQAASITLNLEVAT